MSGFRGDFPVDGRESAAEVVRFLLRVRVDGDIDPEELP